jgi:hypothetical protein
MPVKPQSVTQLLGMPAVLPGESVAQYKASLAALVSELQATTALQVYLAEKIHECLWWIRRYEAQKRNTVVAEMAALTNVSFSPRVTANEEHVRNMFANNQTDDVADRMLKAIRHTPQSLQQKAMAKKAQALQALDQQIALQTKILAGLQASYEVAFNRKLNVERLQLQNSLLRRNLQAIDMPSVQQAQPPADASPAHPTLPGHTGEPNDNPQAA